MCEQALSNKLLEWYDAHARVMPWRISPVRRAAGEWPNPYHVWLSEIMLQQTTVATVKSYFEKFITLWPRLTDLAAANDADVMAAWAGLGYYARARNLLKCARLLMAEYDGVFPTQHKALLALPGVGPYTAAAIGAIAFDQPRTVVDGNVERVMARFYDTHTPLPRAKAKLAELAQTLTPQKRAGDYAQAIMDLGATICTPKSPACAICPWTQNCLARQNGTVTILPRKLPKAPKPTRYGIAYVATTKSGAVLLETRPAKGLLGGMMGWPCTPWHSEQPQDAPPFAANWHECGAVVKHTFTHFHLELRVKIATELAEKEHFTPQTVFRPAALPTVMRKVWEQAALEQSELEQQ